MAKKQLAPGPWGFPMPIVLVGAMVDGKPNYKTAAFVGIVNFKPPIVACGLNPAHHTCRGIDKEGVFSLNLPSADQAVITDYCGLHSGEKIDKSKLFKSTLGRTGAPLIDECKLNLECKLLQTVPFAVDTLYLAQIVAIHAEETILIDDQPDWSALAPLLFTFPDPSYWQLGGYVGKAWDIGKKFGK